jgi:hypothetical protein
VCRFLGRASPVLAVVQDGVAPAPEFFRDDGLDREPDPFALGLEFPLFLVAQGASVVCAPESLGVRVADEALDRCVGELRAVSRAMAAFVQYPGYGFLPAVFQEEFIDQFPNRSPVGKLWNRILQEVREFSDLLKDYQAGRNPSKTPVPTNSGE